MANFEITKYSRDWQEKWDRFVILSKNGTIFHQQRFLSYHPSGRFEDASLIMTKGGQIQALFPAASKTIDGKRYLFSHPGSSYGGLVVNNRFKIAEAFGAIKDLISFAKDNDFKGIIIRHPERVFQRQPAEELDFALSYLGFNYYARELSDAIDISHFKEVNILDNFEKRARNAARKAEKEGVSVSLSEDYETFYQFLCENLKKIHQAKPTHSLEEMKKIKSIFPKEVFLLAAFYERKMIAGIWFFKCNQTAAHTFYIAQDYDFQEYRPLNLIVKELISWGIGENLKYLNFGISTEEKGKAINWNLFEFKESFGASGVRRDSYILKIN